MSKPKGKRILVDSFCKNSEELLQVSLQWYHGELVVDIRSAVIRTSGVKLLRKGLTIRAVQFPRLIQALNKALDSLEGLEAPATEELNKPEEGQDKEPLPWEIEPIDNEEFPF